MADLAVPRAPLAPRSALADMPAPGRYGRQDGPAGLTVSERRGLSLASLITRKDQAAMLVALVKSAYGLDLPGPGRMSGGQMADGRHISFLSAGPAQYLALAEGSTGFAAELTATLGKRAMIAAQTDGRCVLRLSGPMARKVLAKGVTIDLHPHVFNPGDTALTQVHHIGVHLWQLGAVPTYEVALFRSFAESFWDWLSASAAEFGYEVVTDKG